MQQPVIFLVVDDERLLGELAGDLERRFGGDYRVLAERSPTVAVATLERLAAHAEGRSPWWWRPGAWTGWTGWGCCCGPTSCTRRPSGCCWSTGASGPRASRWSGP